eukprot:TCONS_00049643-protein
MAMEQLEGLFFARHHPIYQRLLLYNRIVLQQMQDEMKDLLKVAYTTSVTGNPDSCQGGDACLEEMNKKINFWLNNVGIPSKTNWTETIRSLDNMEKVRANLNDLLHINSSEKHGKKILESDIA